MSKTFYVQPGYEVLSHGAWHRAGLLLWVEPGGTVDISSAPRRGTHVQVRIPLDVPAADAEEQPSGQGTRIA